MRRRVPVLALSLLLAAFPARAQDDVRLPIVELRALAGAFVPTGALRESFHDGMLYSLHGALEFDRRWHVTGSLSMMPNHARVAGTRSQATLLQYDIGLEWSTYRRMDGGWRVQPFVGFGGGMRGWEYIAPSARDRMTEAAFVAIGLEARLRRLAVRVELRDNLSQFHADGASESTLRNDVWVAAGITRHFR